MASLQDHYDTAFIGILQNEGQIAGFLDAIFAFLFRKTDFYVELASKEGKMGFPPGVAEKLVMRAFKKYQSAAKQIASQQREAAATQVNKPPESKPTPIEPQPQPVAKPVEDTSQPQEAQREPVQDLQSGHKSQSSSSQSQESAVAKISSEGAVQPVLSVPNTDAATLQNKSNSNKTDDDDDPELTSQQKIFQENPDSYNGAMRDNYSWSQSITDLDVKISVEDNIRKGRDVLVDIQRKHIIVKCKFPVEDWQTLIEGDLPWDINKEQSMWSLEPGKAILVNLEKVQERWWDSLLINEPKISVRKIDPSRPMTDLDDEAQAKIEELMYNEHQKKLGKPQSHEKKVHDVLRKAWDAEGSPFKGQPFDPSKMNISPDGGMNFNAP